MMPRPLNFEADDEHRIFSGKSKVLETLPKQKAHVPLSEIESDVTRV
jgi:hypothetical protein